MSKKITVIIGLPGSGKTTLGKQICEKTGQTLIDDPKSLKDILHTDGNIVVTDPFLCQPCTREQVLLIASDHFPDCEQEIIFFENNPAQASKNAQERADRSVSGLIAYLTKVYKPIGEIRPVYCP